MKEQDETYNKIPNFQVFNGLEAWCVQVFKEGPIIGSVKVAKFVDLIFNNIGLELVLISSLQISHKIT